MTDTPNRRTPKNFEPPPWERDQFEELAKRREEVRKEAELEAALGELQAQAAEEHPQQPVVPAPEAQAAPAGQGAPDSPVSARENGADQEGSGLDERLLDAMFVQLRAEEHEREGSLWKVGLVFSAVSALIGSVLVVWGIAALVRAGSETAGMIGGITLLMFGGLFVGVGAWMAARGLKERGVL